MFSQSEALEFMSLFSGAQEFYGTTKVGELVDGKAQAESLAIHEIPTPSVFLGHLQGQSSIGISPLKADNTICFGAIDIDDYDGDLNDIIDAIYYYDLPICPCYSKSKKLHLYFFFSPGTLASDAVEIMKWYARAFLCKEKVEIFPKQTERSPRNKAYSWINIPYFECDNLQNHRKLVLADKSLASLDAFIERAKQSKFTLEQHKKFIESIPCYDAPPCVLSGIMLRNIERGGRNNWFFCLAVYLKLKDEEADVEEEVLTVNELMKDPLEERELQQTVIASLNRQSSFYICNQMVDRCNKKWCSKTEFGIGKDRQSSGLVYGQLKQYMTDPPIYDWNVSGQTLRFANERELLGQEKFRALCLRELHLVPTPQSPERWARILNRCAQTMTVEYVEERAGDMTAGSIFFDITCQFFNGKRQATNMSQVLMGRVLETEEHYIFNAIAFLKFVTEVQGFKEFKREEIRQRIVDMGAVIEDGFWKMPKQAVKNVLQDMKKDIQLDLDTHEGESNDF